MIEPADPFGEHAAAPLRMHFRVLGGDFTVESSDEALLDLVAQAFGGLPKHRLTPRPQRFGVRLVLTTVARPSAREAAPPRPMLSAGAGLLCATVDAGSFAVLDVARSSALVCVSKAMLRRRYHARYELIELAFLTLATRAQSLVPLHAACVGSHDRGVLLMGASGAGKSTLSLHALAGGMQVLSEDSAFVVPESLRATGVSSYLHLSRPALRFLQAKQLRRTVERSPIIERRSGARKFEVDLRKFPGSIARGPLQIAATVFLSARPAGNQPAIRELKRADFLARLRREQPYASAQPSWHTFERRILATPAYEMRRTQHPDSAVRLLRDLL
jgi:energy-coupling factor transporter ATP-binding protein EcfA2